MMALASVFKHSDGAESDTDMPACDICFHTHTLMVANSDTDMAACDCVFTDSDTTKEACDICVYAQ
jgi:hypothetical protein